MHIKLNENLVKNIKIQKIYQKKIFLIKFLKNSEKLDQKQLYLP